MDDLKSQILELLAQGLSTQEIAQRLNVSWQTVAGYKGAYPADWAGAVGAPVGSLEDVERAQNLKFGLERDMQDALRRHIDQLDSGLEIVDGGKERQVEAGFIDI